MAAKSANPGGFMTKALRNALILMFSLMLSGTLLVAQASNQKKTDEKSSNKEHHSPFSKAAFWRHHKDSNQKPKTATAQPGSKSAQSQSAQVKPASVKQSSAKQSAKATSNQTTAKKNQKSQTGRQHLANASAKKSPTGSKAKAQKKSPEPKVVSMQQ
jgi:hypothetical protein